MVNVSMTLPGTLLSLLRDATAEAHRRLEETVDISQTARSARRYRRLLEDFLGFHAAAQEKLEAPPDLPRAGYAPAERRKTAWLEADLKALGLSAEEVRALPLCRDLPDLPDAAAAMGCAYVVEGSTLGGRHIAAFLDKSGVIPREARRFFQGYGEETGTKWREFCAALETVEKADHDRAARAAVETFAAMERWLSRPRERSAA